MSKQRAKKEELSLYNDRHKPAQYRSWFVVLLFQVVAFFFSTFTRAQQGNVSEPTGAGLFDSTHQGIWPKVSQ